MEDVPAHGIRRGCPRDLFLAGDRFFEKMPPLRGRRSVRQFEQAIPARANPEALTERDAYVELYGATCKAIAKRLFRLGISSNDLNDALQEIYLEAWRGWNTYDSTMGARVQWLYGITAKVAARVRQRTAKRGKREEPQSDDFDALSGALGGEEYMEINDRARFVARLSEPIDTIPLSIFIAHEMDDEPMEEIARYHGVSLSTAYRLCKQAEYLFTEGYNREQEQRRKAGALVLPVSALSLLTGPHAIPDVSSQFQANLWDRIATEIGNGLPPVAPCASVPAPPRTPPARLDGGAALRAIRSALTAHPIAAPALLFVGGAVAALAGEHLVNALDKNAHPPIAQEARAMSNDGASAAPVTSPTTVSTGSALPVAASDSATPRAESGPAGPVTPAELGQYDVVRAAVRSPDTDSAFKAIQDYLKSYPRGHFVGDCEKMRIETLIRAGRVAEARAAIDLIRKRSPKNPILKELESSLPGP
ncbi:MAG: sigma-70 family RNA polymerase sigma factor [Byssovorax sp.]